MITKSVNIDALISATLNTSHTIRGLYEKCYNHGETNREGSYTYIPVYDRALKEIIEHVGNLEGKIVCDAGAGSTAIANLFLILGAKDAKALEINDVYQRHMDLKRLVKGNILTHDFSEYDIIYTFRPLSDKVLMVKGLKNIIKTMKKGARLYFVYGLDLPAEVEIEVEILPRSDTFVYVKK